MMDASVHGAGLGEIGERPEDRRWMAAAIALGRRGFGRTAPNPSVGAVLVMPDADGGRVVGRGWTNPGGRPHAETMALAQAGEAARGATLYVTLEPCSHYGRTPPCADAIVAAGVTRVVAAMADPDPRVDGRGLRRLREAGVSLVVGVCEREALRLNAGHVARVTLGRPHVALKLAVSADAKVAPAGGGPYAITGEAAQARVHLMRAEADAIMIGVGTALADDPLLTCRLPGLEDRSPIRVVLDADLRTPLDSRLVATAQETPTWIVSSVEASADRETALRAQGVEVLRVGRGDDGRLSLAESLELLALCGVTRLMVEGGPTLASALKVADLIDEITIVSSHVVLGPGAVDALAGRPLAALTRSPRFFEAARERVAQDVWTVYERV